MKIPGLALSAGTDDVPWRSTESPGVRWLLLANEEHQGPEPPARGEGRGSPILPSRDMDAVLIPPRLGTISHQLGGWKQVLCGNGWQQRACFLVAGGFRCISADIAAPSLL